MKKFKVRGIFSGDETIVNEKEIDDYLETDQDKQEVWENVYKLLPNEKILVEFFEITRIE